MVRPITVGLLVVGVVAIGASLWSTWGWEAACAWWGSCLLAAGLSEVF